MVKDERNENALLRLFRHSSFVWRIYGSKAREEQYVRQLVDAGVAGSAGKQEIEIGTLDRERAYLIIRELSMDRKAVDALDDATVAPR
jgi:hypothetical protein